MAVGLIRLSRESSRGKCEKGGEAYARTDIFSSATPMARVKPPTVPQSARPEATNVIRVAAGWPKRSADQITKGNTVEASG